MDDRLNIRLETALTEKIKINARRLGISISGYIRMAVIEKLNKDNDAITKLFAEFKQETL